ncbi:MAG: hypothetical protein GF401_18310 [Chitinivibrionales bacterium]|nr:hypothetical protein [Chitinivibrionales bacterium]
MEKMKIFVSGASLSMNLGGPSIFHGLVKVLRHAFPDCRIVYHEATNISEKPESSPVSSPDYPDVRFVYGSLDSGNQTKGKRKLLRSMYNYTRHFGPLIGRVWRKQFGSYNIIAEQGAEIAEEIRTSDLYIEAWGIAFADSLRKMKYKRYIKSNSLMKTAAFFGIKSVHYTASYGPMNRIWSRLAAQKALGSLCSLVYCREIESQNNLLSCGIPSEKLIVAPDTGFLMPSVADPQLKPDSSRPCVGVSVSHQIHRQWSSETPYIQLIARICDRIRKEWNARILLIPNELSDKRYDDTAVAEDILLQISEKQDIEIYPARQRTAPEQKGVIAHCDLLIASRYHSIVAAMSKGTPTVVVGWHHKYGALLDRFAQENCGLSCRDCDETRLWNLCKEIWANRREIKKTITTRIPELENEIYTAAEKMRSLFCSDIGV